MTAPPDRITRGGASIVAPAAITVVALAILIGLGVWQIERKSWKEGLIAALAQRQAAAPVPLPQPVEWPRLSPPRDEYRRVTVAAEFVGGQDALVYAAPTTTRLDVTGTGFWVLSPARLPGGGTIVVNRGFVPAAPGAAGVSVPPAPAGVVQLTGAMRWPEARGMLSPTDDPAGNVWYVRDTSGIASAKGWGNVAPFYVEMESPVPAAGLPRPGRLSVNLPNNHLQYALTWFGLAGALLCVFLIWLRGRYKNES